MKKFGAITSSTNPDEIANRVKGFTLAVSSIIVLVATQIFHLQVNANDITSLATELGAVAGAIWTIYGFGMSVWAYFFKQA